MVWCADGDPWRITTGTLVRTCNYFNAGNNSCILFYTRNCICIQRHKFAAINFRHLQSGCAIMYRIKRHVTADYRLNYYDFANGISPYHLRTAFEAFKNMFKLIIDYRHHCKICLLSKFMQSFILFLLAICWQCYVYIICKFDVHMCGFFLNQIQRYLK